jgi:hypothetical protein
MGGIRAGARTHPGPGRPERVSGIFGGVDSRTHRRGALAFSHVNLGGPNDSGNREASAPPPAARAALHPRGGPRGCGLRDLVCASVLGDLPRDGRARVPHRRRRGASRERIPRVPEQDRDPGAPQDVPSAPGCSRADLRRGARDRWTARLPRHGSRRSASAGSCGPSVLVGSRRSDKAGRRTQGLARRARSRIGAAVAAGAPGLTPADIR